MFEDKTYENLLQEKLDTVSEEYDKREGSIIYDALAPNSAEMAQAYITLEWMLKQMFGDTASREYLIRIANDTKGMSPYESSYAVRKGEFNVAITLGTRFSIETVNYAVTRAVLEPDSATGHYTYQLTSETKGVVGNQYSGTLIPIDYVSGLTYAKLTEVLIPGEEEEETETFRERWLDSFNTTAFGGNRADYISKIKEISGVGGVKCYRTTDPNGKTVGGYVKCIVIASNYTAPTNTLVSVIQERIDPSQTGSGDGIAPIGHYVTIAPVSVVDIQVKSNFTFGTGFTFASLKSKIEDAINTYFSSLSAKWESSDNLIVRVSAIENVLLDIEGIIDIGGTTLNGTATNMILGFNEIPMLSFTGVLT